MTAPRTTPRVPERSMFGVGRSLTWHERLLLVGTAAVGAGVLLAAFLFYVSDGLVHAARSPVKRALDVVGALVGLTLAAPALFVATLLVRLTLGTPVLFTQDRLGRGGRVFRAVKLRTMRDGPEPDAERLTPLGRWLRRWSVDEIPQLWHVLVGEMSLVGPRPLPARYGPRYSPEQARRHEVRPGLTGWAQIHGRNAVDWSERLALDVWYVEHQSLALDLRILARTVALVLGGRGVSAQGEATMREFQGGD